MTSDTLRKCRVCGTEKPVTAFVRSRKYRGKQYFLHTCKPCFKARPLTDEQKERYKRRNRVEIWRKNGVELSYEAYERMGAAQNNVCAICFSVNANGKGLHVDHCHATGKLRGLLCGKCNSGLGLFNDNILKIQNAAAYLLRHA